MKPSTTDSKPSRRTRASDRPPPVGNEPTTRVLQQFRIIFNAVKAHFQQVERRAGVGGAQIWALSIVRERSGLGVNDLASAMSIRQPTASNLVKNLSLQGLVEVRRDGPDRRAVQLHILPEGRKLLRRAPGPFAGVLPEALASLDDDSLLRLETDLAKVIKALKVDDRAGSIPLAQL